jgi:putative mycofactocin binding protein MftB
MTVSLGAALELHPQVAVRPEPFGALAYHYGNRRLVFLKHADVVTVVQSLDGERPLAEVLTGCGVDERRWPSFVKALENLEHSEIVRERAVAD